MTLQVGDKIPAFRGETSAGPLSAADLLGHAAVLYFYPKDDTPGCTIEACAFRDNLPRFTKMNVKVFGISKDNLKAHARFADNYELPFTLISDTDGSICEAFDVWCEKVLFGRKYMGIERATYLVDENGVIRQIWRNVKVLDHAEEILSTVKNLK